MSAELRFLYIGTKSTQLIHWIVENDQPKGNQWKITNPGATKCTYARTYLWSLDTEYLSFYPSKFWIFIHF